ncbi:hypothetical protein HLB44_22075 [Aquincola sp. S2]|uniref:Uncharacterized protein n=1 Tax=Pseudaquabacterium terrae TaxID=2732868 RepID=A0ABX2EM92_9BURK|nr:hypothetical protein [Aquabacterium terrae]NRF69697.1 hypothetical protein [Aquabacterium terrae]
MNTPLGATLWARPALPDEEPLHALDREERVMMGVLRLIVAAGLAVGLLGATVRLMG